MGLLDNFAPPVKVWNCKVRDTAAKLDAADAKILLEAVEGSEWSIKGLSEALAKRGVAISDVPIKAHRSKACSCFRN